MRFEKFKRAHVFKIMYIFLLSQLKRSSPYDLLVCDVQHLKCDSIHKGIESHTVNLQACPSQHQDTYKKMHMTELKFLYIEKLMTRLSTNHL